VEHDVGGMGISCHVLDLKLAHGTCEDLQSLVVRGKRLVVVERRITRVKGDAIQMVEYDWARFHET
jgi:hypothetical protein